MIKFTGSFRGRRVELAWDAGRLAGTREAVSAAIAAVDVGQEVTIAGMVAGAASLSDGRLVRALFLELLDDVEVLADTEPGPAPLPPGAVA